MIKKYPYESLITCLGIVFFIPFLWSAHLFDWDEINFAEAAREMIVSGDYLRVKINFQPFWEKPPLFIWMQVLCMKVFGINEFAARLPNAICGITTLILLFRIGRQFFSERMGLLWVLVYGGSFLPFLYFKSGIIDPWFNLFIFLAFYYCTFLFSLEKTRRPAALAGVFFGLAVLTKGPVAILIALLSITVLIVLDRFRVRLKIIDLVLVALACMVTCLAWFGIELLINGPWFLQEFIVYQIRLLQTQDAGHGGPFYYHWIVLMIGCFPASIFALKGFFKQEMNPEQSNFHRLMAVLFWVVLILFSIVKTKIMHYSSLCYFPLTFMAAYALDQIIAGKITYPRWYNTMITIIGGIIAFVLIAFPFLVMHKEQFMPYIKDEFALANLQANVHWSGFESIGGVVLLLGIIIAIRLIRRTQYLKGVYSLSISVAISMFMSMYLIVPRIEQYSQAAAIRFYQSKAQEDCYVEVIGFKSYAHLFYTNKKPLTNPMAFNKDWLLNGNIDKPAYFVVKLNRQEGLDIRKDLKQVGAENGFVFFKREVLK